MAFALAPLDEADARDLVAELHAKRLLGPLRGLPRVDTDQLQRHPPGDRADGRRSPGDRRDRREPAAGLGHRSGRRRRARDPDGAVPSGAAARTPGAAAAGVGAASRRLLAASVAVVGASEDPRKWGGSVLRNLTRRRLRGRASTPINPRGGTIIGLPAYASPDDLPETPDLVIVRARRGGGDAGRRPSAADAECRRRSSSPRASPRPAKKARRCRQELARAADEGGVTLVGPNCMGVLCTSAAPERRRLRHPAAGGRATQRDLAVRQHRHAAADDRGAARRRRREVREQRQPGDDRRQRPPGVPGRRPADRRRRHVPRGARRTAAASTSWRARRRRASRSSSCAAA